MEIPNSDIERLAFHSFGSFLGGLPSWLEEKEHEGALDPGHVIQHFWVSVSPSVQEGAGEDPAQRHFWI